ncbi:MAG: flagellar filament capping protein FliD [Gammaproteobacteria bacterium]|nr:flagellar filament capping protein FliD [Gammaproteobacteria bacterium]MBU1480849.1 flagellar filament capping protein FliD [Gammaproteobacteria bacterium]
MATSGISSSTTGATLDVPSLVSQLMTAERQPINKLNTKSSNYSAQITALGLITSKVDALQTAAQSLGSTSSSSLLAFTATSSNTSALSATASTSAVAGNYSVNVTALAQSQRLVAVGQVSDTATIDAGTSTTVTFDFGTTVGSVFTSNGSGTQSITIDSSNNTLQGIRDAINAAGMGVSATIVNDGSGTPYRLALSSDNTGASNSLRITTDGAGNGVDNLLAYDPGGTQNLTQTLAAQNAAFNVNGIAITKSSNTVTDAIQGVTLTLSAVTTTPATLTVARDTAAVSAAAASFVTAYNDLYSSMKNSYAYDSGSSLAGDATLRNLQSQMRDIAASAVGSGNLTHLFEVGISFKADGTMQLNSATLNSAMASSFSDVATLFNSATGFATRFEAWATTTLSVEGTLANHTSAINQRISTISDQISALELRMTVLQRQYTAQFTALDVALTSMNSTSAYLTQQFAAMQNNN